MKKRLMLAMAASLVLGASVPTLAQESSASPEAADPDASIVASPSPADALRGTWDYEMTQEEAEAFAASFGPEEAAAAGLPASAISLRLGIDDEAWWLGFVFDGELWLLDGEPEGDGGTMTVDGDRLTQTNGRDGWATYEWSLDGDQLTLTLLECIQQAGEGECPDVDIVREVTEHTYTFSSSDPGY